MNDIIRKKNREECFKNYINEIMRNREIDCDEEWWSDENAHRELKELAEAQDNYITDSRTMNIEGAELIFAVYRGGDSTFKEMIQGRIDSSFPDSRKSNIQRIFFVRDMRSRISLEKIFDRSIICILVEEYAGQDVKLRNLNRFEMIQEPPVSGKINLEKRSCPSSSADIKPVKGLVCTVDLLQIVELYNMLGDRLFKYNVRIGIKEILGVDSAIRRTLATEPGCFWFKNNGITILVENPNFRIDNTEELLLDWVEPEKELGFSVVNGAQTINTAARYFYELDYQLKNSNPSERKEIEKKVRMFREARVLLRIIHVSVDDVSQPSVMAKEISVALNRQKPIRIEDIAFTSPFVERLTKYLAAGSDRENCRFQLVRRGEKTDDYWQIDLVEFARARLACAGYPGDARAKGADLLLKARSEEGEDKTFFDNKTIFTEGWQDADDSEADHIFRRDYNAVLYAHQIAMGYEKSRSMPVSGGQDIQNVIKNGKWYFTAFLIQMINDFKQYERVAGGEKQPDFSDFECEIRNVLDNIPGAIKCFAEIVVSYIRIEQASGKYGELDSNLFKKNDLYRDMMRELEDRDRFTAEEISKRPFLEQCRKFAGVFKLGLFHEAWSENRSEETGEERGRTGKYVILGKNEWPVRSDAEALARVVEYILTYYPPEGEWMEETDDWITDDRRVGLGGQKYFRGTPRLVEVNGTGYWVGTHSNTQAKCRQMQQLCRLTNVPQGSISWYKNSVDDPEFTW